MTRRKEAIEYLFTRSADKTKLGAQLSTLKGKAAIQTDLDRPKEWKTTNLMIFSNNKS